MQNIDLILDPPGDGAWNMAVDESLLQLADETGQGTLRFYQWSRPTLSLGYFQKFSDRKLHPPSVPCDIVRRSSGGGAIVHDLELTYSLSLPGTNRWSSKQNDLYGSVHDAMIRFLNERGIPARQFAFPVKDHQKDLEREGVADYVGPTESSNVANDRKANRFLCFQRRTAGDIVLDGYKIGGSAQRRFSNATLQHGSLLLKQSSNAPELPGLAELSGTEMVAGEIAGDLAEAFADGLHLRFERKGLSRKQENIAKEIHVQKYDNADWTCKR